MKCLVQIILWLTDVIFLPEKEILDQVDVKDSQTPRWRGPKFQEQYICYPRGVEGESLAM